MSSFLLFTKQLFKSNLINGLKVSKVISKPKPIGIRFLFTDEILGIPGYLQTKDRISVQFGQMRDKFFARMEEYSHSESKMVFTEDLKNIIFLTENNEKELNLLSDSIKKFHSQNQSLQFGTFVFGPLVMRLLYHLSQYELALKLFKDPELKGFFNQIKSSVILMNLLFINGKYEECMQIMDWIQNESQFNTKYPRDCLLLYMASAYKLNTPESFDKAIEMIKKARDAGAPVSRKTVCLFAALCLNQNQPNTALEILSLVTQTNYISVRNLRFIALSELQRFDDIFIAIRLILNREVPPENKRQEIFEETLNKIKESVESKDDKQLSLEFSQIERSLRDGDHISPNTLEQIMLTPVVLRTDPNQMGRDNYRYSQQRGYTQREYTQQREYPQQRGYSNQSTGFRRFSNREPNEEY